jgi:lysophospholipase L1-like esterase
MLKLCLAATLCATPLLAQTAPSIEKVQVPPNLIPTPITVGGRVITAPSGAPAPFASGYESQWPGTYFETAFKGSELYFRVGINHEILHVLVDSQEPLVLVNPEAGVFRLSGLANTRHAVAVSVVTESQQAPNTFAGFAIPPGEEGLPAIAPSRQIEFIGDSHTVGYGNASPKRDCTTGEVWASTDNSRAFGPLTAHHYNAAYQINAISGRGIVRNYNGTPGDTIPLAFPYVLFDRKQLYRDPAWKPRIIVIALGTNDFSTPLNPGEKWKTRDELHADYEATYLHLLESLRAQNHDAYLILWATSLANDEIESEVRKVVEQARAHGETKIAFIPFDHLKLDGCHSHPSLTDDRTISDGLVNFIDRNHLWGDN